MPMSQKHKRQTFSRLNHLQCSVAPLRDFASLETVLGGTTIGQIQQVEVNLPASEIPSVLETVIDTSPSGTRSVPLFKPRKNELPSFSIQSTPCCGMHTVNGFQYDPKPDLCEFLHGLQKSLDIQCASMLAMQEQNEKDKLMWREKTREFYPEFVPMRNPENMHFRATKIAAMMVFTWNSRMYDATAKRFGEFVKEHGLGSVTITNKIVNPNSHHEIAAMVWNVKIPEYKKFLADNPLV